MKHNPAFEALCEEITKGIKEVTVQNVKVQLDSDTLPLFIDVREESEWNRSHLPNAQHMGRGIIERDIETRVPNKATTIILYCGGGYRSALSADNLQKMGYTEVFSMAGGYRAWMEAGYPIIEK